MEGVLRVLGRNVLDPPANVEVSFEFQLELCLVEIGLQLFKALQVPDCELLSVRVIEESSVLDLAIDDEFAAGGAGADLGNLVDNLASIDGAERDEVAVLDGLVGQVVVLPHLEDVPQVEKVPFPVPLGVLFVLLAGDSTVL